MASEALEPIKRIWTAAINTSCLYIFFIHLLLIMCKGVGIEDD